MRHSVFIHICQWALLCVLGFVSLNVSAQERVEFSAESDFYSQYVWRGLAASEGFVWQPSLNVQYYGFGFNVWANLPVAPQPNQGQFNEVDLTPYYTREIEKFTIATWLDLELYPNRNPKSLNDSETTLEWGLHVAHPVGPLFLFTELTVDMILAPGAVFWNMGVGYRRPLPWKFSIETMTLFGIANSRFTGAYVGPVGTVPYQVEWNLSFPWTPLKHWTFTPKIGVSTLLDGGLRAASGDPTIVWGGLSVLFAWSPAP